MINVVFLLLIFFLMTSHLAKPEPFDVALPTTSSQREPKADRVLYADRDGQLAFGALRAEAAIAGVAAAASPDTPIQLRADGAMEAVAVANLLRRLAEAGLTRVELVVAPK
ncbi:MAG: biopolymer transporter ExbD [Pseudomonadota bacterium]|nr:biopolymer transporter ExbD [Pseudomonadota bacterium]